MKTLFRQPWLYVMLGVAAMIAILVTLATPAMKPPAPAKPEFSLKIREHMDHAPLITGTFKTGPEVTKACLKCHPEAGREMLKSAHFQWVGREIKVPGHDGTYRIGKRNAINNFCIGIQGNWPSCTRCHAGYGWNDDSFDFTDESAVDCLVCHDGTGTYKKGPAGIPGPDVDLTAVARSVAFPKRSNCGLCHNFGGGGMGVKHGDLDASLNNPLEQDDVHMGRENLLCIDCHKTEKHDISGTSMSVSITRDNGVFCENCHTQQPHGDERLNAHLSAVSCETCHIPTYARRNPTKTFWDWSKAGDDSRPDDPHHYLKIKGEFVYDNDVTPVYRWYNGTAERYLLGDKIDPSKTTAINSPIGKISDPKAKIHPFKIHYAVQPYDAGNNMLAVPTTSGPGGYWHEFDWDKAMILGAKATGLPYSGKMGFTRTEMYWPLSHMVVQGKDALSCGDCHGEGGRMNWKELGYQGDPAQIGGREMKGARK
ncbi:MAG: tetrathionate reductase family octaheme c-type cytochrome [Deltaproteobacteria bacterium]|nr:tetrathionate reductase family octaheme c-type cytochrome [Deltaproteobacteria bacterium]